jgi:hypothetical protein
MAKRPLEVYVPSQPPDAFIDWSAWITGELRRIAQSFREDLTGLYVDCNGTIPIAGTGTAEPIGIGFDSILDRPGGSWDPLTGEWAVPVGGIYNISLLGRIEPFGAGNKSYFAEIEVWVDPVGADPYALRAVSVDSGLDDVPLGISIARPIQLNPGDKIQLRILAIHEQFTGTVNYDVEFSYQLTWADN